jgi:hypothetical protein
LLCEGDEALGSGFLRWGHIEDELVTWLTVKIAFETVDFISRSPSLHLVVVAISIIMSDRSSSS